MSKAVRTAAAIGEAMHVIEFAVSRLRELTDDHPLTVRIEVNNVQECVDLLRHKLHELRRAGTQARLSAKKPEQPYLVPLIQSPPQRP